MYDRNGKSERILTKLGVLDYEYICDRIAKFRKKILFTPQVINIQILMTEYFQYALHTAVRHSERTTLLPTEHARQCMCSLIKHRTSSLQLWPANSPDLTPVDY